MSALADLIAIFNDPALAALGGIETIIYVPYQAAEREIQAQVDRLTPTEDFVVGSGEPKIVRTLYILNHPTLGVTAPKVGLDWVRLLRDVGDTDPSIFRVSSVLNQSTSLYTIQVVL